jgi:uncharacterized protein
MGKLWVGVAFCGLLGAATIEEERFESIGIPVHTFGGWYDILAQGALNGYVGVSKKGKTASARQQSKMIVGPWGHGPTRKYGEIARD